MAQDPMAEDAAAILARSNLDGTWTEVAPGHSSEAITLTLNRIVVTLNDGQAVENDDRNLLVYPAHSSAPAILSEPPVPGSEHAPSSSSSVYTRDFSDVEVGKSLHAFQERLTSTLTGSHHSSNICYKPPSSSECFGTATNAQTVTSTDAKSALFAVGLNPSADSQDWVHHVAGTIEEVQGHSYVPLSPARKKADNGLGLSFSAFPPTRGFHNASRSATSFNEEEARSVRWMLYAGRAFVMRFYALAKVGSLRLQRCLPSLTACDLQKADSADIFVMLIGYLLMHLTFINTFINMRKLGSKFWLGCSTLVSGTFGFLLALFTASLLGISINPIVLSEALPFLIITIGFEKPFLLARAVFTNPALTPISKDPLLRSRIPSKAHIYPSSSTNSRITAFGPHPEQDDSEPNSARPGIRWSQPVPAKDIVLQGFEKVGKQIVRDYAFEIAVLIAGSFTGVSGLKEFCQLAALILIFDCLFLFGFFASVLTVMVEVRRIGIMRGLRRTDSSADLAHILDDGTTPDVNSAPVTAELTAGQRFKRLLLGNPAGEAGESPTARLKLLLISAFLGLHVLNLCTTLTSTTAITRHREASTGHPGALAGASPLASNFLSTNPATGPLSSILAELSALHPSYDIPLVVQVPPAITYRLVLPGATSPALAREAVRSVERSRGVAGSMAILDRFMSSWTKLVGDPVLSKWIVIVLVVSVFLNGYLLKGIAVGDQGFGDGFLPNSAPEAATRLLLGSKQDSKDAKIKRRWSGGVEGMARLPAEWTLADAAEMAKERRKELIQDEKERDAAHLEAAKLKKQRKPSSSADSSDDSAPGSPLFISTKKRASSAVAGRLISANEKTIPLPPTILTPNGSAANGKSGHSETSSEAATDTPATTVLDETDIETPTVPQDSTIVRGLDEIHTIFAAGKGADLVSDEEVILLVQKGKIAAYALEKLLKDNMRAVKIRRALICKLAALVPLSLKLICLQLALRLPRHSSIRSCLISTTTTARSWVNAART